MFSPPGSEEEEEATRDYNNPTSTYKCKIKFLPKKINNERNIYIKSESQADQLSSNNESLVYGFQKTWLVIIVGRGNR